MTYRMYATSDASGITPARKSGSWTQGGSFRSGFALKTTKSVAAGDLGGGVDYILDGISAGVFSSACMSFVSPPFTQAGTFTGTLQSCLNAVEDVGTINAFEKIIVRIVNTAGTIEHFSQTFTGGVEFPIGWPGQARTINLNCASSWAVTAGMRLIIEFGSAGTSAGSGVAGYLWGGNSGSDATNGQSLGTTPTWIDLPDPLASLFTTSNLPGVVLPWLDLASVLMVEIAWGADLSNISGSGWSWTDVTEEVRQNSGITSRVGRPDEQSDSTPATCSFVLDDPTNKYVLGNSANWPNVRLGTPVRVRVDPGTGGFRTVFQGYLDGLTPAYDSAKADVKQVRVSAAGFLKRMQRQSIASQSVYRRANVNDTYLTAYWPMEDGRNAVQFENIRGGQAMTVNGGVSAASDDHIGTSAPLPTFGNGSAIALVDTYTPDPTAYRVEFVLYVPPEGLADGSVLAYIYTTGSQLRTDVVWGSSGGGHIDLYMYSNAFVNNDTLITNPDEDLVGRPMRVAVYFSSSTGTYRIIITMLDSLTTYQFSDSVVGGTFGIVNQIIIAPNNVIDGSPTIGHLAVRNTFLDFYTTNDQLTGFAGEDPASSAGRLVRLASEYSIYLDRRGATGEVIPDSGIEDMGAQPSGSVYELMRTCEEMDQGVLYDGRGPGLQYTTRRFKENNEFVLTVDYSSSRLSPGFAGVFDDQRVVNSAIATRYKGANAQYIQTTGEMSVAKIGTYEASTEINALNDSASIYYAAFLVALGTVEGYRFPEISIILRAQAFTYVTDCLNTFPGSKIKLTNLPAPYDKLGDIYLVVEGIQHVINSQEWVVTFACSNAEGWNRDVLQDDSYAVSRPFNDEFILAEDEGSITVFASAVAGATSLQIVGAALPYQTEHGSTSAFPLYLEVLGQRIRCTSYAFGGPGVCGVDALPFAVPAGSVVKIADASRLAL